jgi:hypothetical protein
MINIGIALPNLSVFHASLRTIEPTVSILLLSLPIGTAIAGRARGIEHTHCGPTIRITYVPAAMATTRRALPLFHVADKAISGQAITVETPDRKGRCDESQ